MKKVILALAIVSVSFVACESKEEKTETPLVDTSAIAPAVDSLAAHVDSTVAPVMDSLQK